MHHYQIWYDLCAVKRLIHPDTQTCGDRPSKLASYQKVAKDRCRKRQQQGKP